MAFATRSPDSVTYTQNRGPLRPDIVLVLTYLTISSIGLLMIYSATAPGLLARGIDPARELKTQAMFMLVGFVVFAVLSSIDVTEIRGFVGPIYIAVIAMLVLVLTPVGDSQGVAQRWIDLGPIQFQPSELAKIGVILMLGSVLASSDVPLTWQTVARALVVVGVPSVLIFAQPDLGTMLVFAFLLLAMLFVGGSTLRQLGFLFVTTAVGVVGVFQVGLIREYQINRLTAFIDPGAYELSLSYNQVQSLAPAAFSAKACSRVHRRIFSSFPFNRPISSSPPLANSSVSSAAWSSLPCLASCYFGCFPSRQLRETDSLRWLPRESQRCLRSTFSSISA